MKNKETYIRRGKQILKKIKNYQIEIAAMAVELCEIRHGGITPKEVYTLKKYSEDIGMNAKTLSNWVTVYRDIICKLPSGTKINYNDAKKTHEFLRQEQTKENKNNNSSRSITNYKRDMPAKTVTNLYNNISSGEKPFIGEFHSMVNQIKNKKHILNKRDLGIIEDSNLLGLMELFDECSDIINDFLTEKKRKEKYNAA